MSSPRIAFQSVPALLNRRFPPYTALSGQQRRNYAKAVSPNDFAHLVSAPTSQIQAFISRSTDPYVNLSIEHFLLQKTPASSKVLFLYTNRPCVVIGRNQNPWVEANLHLLKSGTTPQAREPEASNKLGEADAAAVWLVRRRSGGGAVFHDEGNVNYSVICPTAEFSRDKHAEMVVRALRRLGVDRARVNERHDIVLDQGEATSAPNPDDCHKTPYTLREGHYTPRPLKASGSAYKLTRLRALHHGTCLLQSPNLGDLSRYLRSPSRPYIKARGVESVSSPVGNTFLSKEAFEQAIVSEFGSMYGLESTPEISEYGDTESREGWIAGLVDDSYCNVPDIAKGVAELKSQEWIYTQTPQFTFSSHPSEDDDRPRPALPEDIPASSRFYLTVRSGAISSSHISISANLSAKIEEARRLHDALKDRKLHEIEDWSKVLQASGISHDPATLDAVGRWAQTLLGT
ncbi:MAG: hypothetical protein M4579_001190 [Chaenotheca gracillima]|nr:MAG: hypothetical protein M4579_001190 [Chaenotheca gracillima]